MFGCWKKDGNEDSKNEVVDADVNRCIGCFTSLDPERLRRLLMITNALGRLCHTACATQWKVVSYGLVGRGSRVQDTGTVEST